MAKRTSVDGVRLHVALEAVLGAASTLLLILAFRVARARMRARLKSKKQKWHLWHELLHW